MAGREVPSVPPSLDPATRNFLSAVREIVNSLPKTVAAAVTTVTEKNDLSLTKLKALLPGVSPFIGWILDTTTPTKPTNFTVTGLFNTIFLHWDYPQFTNYNFTEIYRANALDITGQLIPVGDVNFSTDAKLISTSSGNIYSDPVDPGSKYYYWIRFVSMANVAGPYYQSNGVLGETAWDINTLLTANGWTVDAEKLYSDGSWLDANDIIDETIDTSKIKPFAVKNAQIGLLAVDTAQIKNAAIKNTKIGIAAIETAHIGDLQVTGAKIKDLGVEKLIATAAWINSADILNGAITNLKIGNTLQSDNYVPGQSGWLLSRVGGELIVNQLTVHDGAGNVILSSGAGVPWDYINGRPTELGQLDSSAATALESAKTHADAAIARLDDIVSDSKLTPEEKKDVLKEWESQLSDYPIVIAQASAYTNYSSNHPDALASVEASVTDYEAKSLALATYLNNGAAYTSGTPLWISSNPTYGLSVTTDIVGATFRAKFADYYNAKSALLKTISDAAHSAYIGYNVYGQITVANASTYIADLAVNTAQIGHQAITFPMGIRILLYSTPVTFGAISTGPLVLGPRVWTPVPGATLVLPPTNPTSVNRGPVLLEISSNISTAQSAGTIHSTKFRVVCGGAIMVEAWAGAIDKNIVNISSSANAFIIEVSSMSEITVDRIVMTVTELKK